MSNYSIEDVQNEVYFAEAEFIRASLKSMYPTFDSGPGTAINDLIITPLAKLQAVQSQKNEAFYSAFTETNLSQLEDDTLVNLVLSRYFLSSNSGTKAKGTLYFVTSNNSPLVIPSNTNFTTTDGGLVFVTTQITKVVRTESQVVADTDTYYRSFGTSQYYFTVPVEAVAEGSLYNISQRTSFIVAGINSNVVQIFAASDFTGGDDVETTADAIARIPERYSAGTTGSVQNIKSLITSEFPSVEISIVGKADSVMLRDSRNPLGLSLGGKSDVYIRSQISTASEERIVTAVLEDPLANKFSVTIASSGNEGIYAVESVSPVSAILDLQILSVDYGVTGVPAYIDIPDTYDAFGSKYYTVKVTFKDVHQATEHLAVGATRDFKVTVFSMPLVADIDTYITAAEIRNPGLDVLVKGVIPAVVSTNLKVMLYSGDPVPSESELKSSILSAISEYGVGREELDSSMIKSAVQRLLGQRSYVDTDTFAMTCTIYEPAGTKTTITDSKKIKITERAALGISKKSVGFLSNESFINIEFETFS